MTAGATSAGTNLRGERWLHVDMCAHNKSGIAYQDRNRRPETVVNLKGNPASSRGCYQGVPVEHLVQSRQGAGTVTESCRYTS
jgi:hypothetical protein